MAKSPAALLIDENGNKVGIVLDGSVYRLQQAGKVQRASDGAYINPATQETLTAIKDTDGIKKITDQLPAGTNEIGKVAQGTKAAAADAWPEYLVDSAGHSLGVVQDGSVYRLQVETKQAAPPAALTVSDYLKNGSNYSLVVDGSGTPVVFSFPADSTDTIYLTRLKVVMVSTGMVFSGTSFSKGSALTNGLLFEAVLNDGEAATLANVKANVDFARLPEFYTEFNAVSGDLVTATFDFSTNERLVAGTSDVVKVTVRDNFTNIGLYGVAYLTATLYGYKEL